MPNARFYLLHFYEHYRSYPRSMEAFAELHGLTVVQTAYLIELGSQVYTSLNSGN